MLPSLLSKHLGSVLLGVTPNAFEASTILIILVVVAPELSVAVTV